MNIDKGNALPAVIIAAALVVCAVIAAVTVVHVKGSDETVVVTGSAKKRIKSDMVIWRATVTCQAPQLSAAYKRLNADVPRVRAYLVGKGILQEQIVISSITTKTLHAKGKDGSEDESGPPVAYFMEQSLVVTSSDVDKVAALSREVTELINQGILLDSNEPEYIYTKIGDLKVAMLAEAAKDAKVRAEQIASSTGDSISKVRSARMGVLQITAANSTEVSDMGVNDTSSLEKDITAVVNMSFSLR